jgi:hypothetical protein
MTFPFFPKEVLSLIILWRGVGREFSFLSHLQQKVEGDWTLDCVDVDHMLFPKESPISSFCVPEFNNVEEGEESQ